MVGPSRAEQAACSRIPSVSCIGTPTLYLQLSELGGGDDVGSEHRGIKEAGVIKFNCVISWFQEESFD